MSIKFSVVCIILLMHNITHTFFSPLLTKQEQPFLIMLDPAGSAADPGRIIHDAFERGITLQLAHALKALLERTTNCKVIITRIPGQTTEPLHNASCANRLNADLYISLHCYPAMTAKPSLYLYAFSYQDPIITKKFELSLLPYQQAYEVNRPTTDRYSDLLQKTFTADTSTFFNYKGLYKIPFKPLIGILAPAFGVECGVTEHAKIEEYAQGLAGGIIKLVEYNRRESQT